MWKWEQGRLRYFQFDVLRKIAKFAMESDIRHADHDELVEATGFQFPSGKNEPWRNYARVFGLSMIVVPDGEDSAQVTEIGQRLAIDGEVTTDEYLHFLARCTTDPSPALSGWDHSVEPRYPLLFVLRILLARASQGYFTTRINRIISAYSTSEFFGDEDQTRLLDLIPSDTSISEDGRFSVERVDDRQASESIKFLAQLSYLAVISGRITVSLAKEDARTLTSELTPINGNHLADSSEEILRRAALFPGAINEIQLDYPATIMTNEQEAGFLEGGRIKRTHLALERNSRI